MSEPPIDADYYDFTDYRFGREKEQTIYYDDVEYKNKPIAYSLVNFIFDQNDIENKESIILNVLFEDNVLSLQAIFVQEHHSSPDCFYC